MKCLSCGNEEFDEGDVKVEGKLYGIIVKTDKKRKAKALVCKNCKMIFFIQKED